jgi:hypothetical protein
MKNASILLAVTSCAALAVACGSSSSGNGASSGASSGSASSGSASSGSASSGSASSGTTNPFADGGFPTINLDAAVACASASDCGDVEGGPGICCIAPGFSATSGLMVTVCEPAGQCPSTILGAFQLCKSSTECTDTATPDCAPFMVAGFAIGSTMVCSAPPAEGGGGSGSSSGSGSRSGSGSGSGADGAAPQDAATGG